MASRSVIAWILALFAVPVLAADINGFRVWTDPDKTRAVLDLDAVVDYQVFTLDNPPRVVIDLPNSDLDHALGLVDEHAGVIDRVRHGRPDKNTLRIVLDLASSSTLKSFMLDPTGDYGHRLVIDLFPQDAGASAAVVKQITDLPSPNRDVVIAVDAGHGGEDPGATGKSRTREKDVVLAIARELKATIDARPGMSAVLVRTGDYYIPLRDRFEKARKHRADLFVSIHADAFKKRDVAGSSVFVLSRKGASSEFARRLAANENSADLVGGVTLSDKDNMLASVLLDLSQSATMEASHAVANSVFASLRSVGKTHKNQVEHANFMVLKSPDVPSILVETAFISNPSEEQRLRDPAWQRKVAQVIGDGVQDYFYLSPPPGTWIAANRQPLRYRVVRGDTLGEIANRYRVSLYSLRRANGLNGDTIHVGSELLIPTT
ncbi:MAG TPA: N-acetylmuramoyl-L-alanine amidase [Xanthomonadales bacterium]|nr:N-acetylmuramoyl-L-alanine amidase [Xanthomonadales bacterium]